MIPIDSRVIIELRVERDSSSGPKKASNNRGEYSGPAHACFPHVANTGSRERFVPFLKNCIIETISKKEKALCPEEERRLNEIDFIRNASKDIWGTMIKGR